MSKNYITLTDDSTDGVVVCASCSNDKFYELKDKLGHSDTILCTECLMEYIKFDTSKLVEMSVPNDARIMKFYGINRNDLDHIKKSNIQ